MTMITNIKKLWHVFRLMAWTHFMKLIVGQFYCLSNTTEYPKIIWCYIHSMVYLIVIIQYVNVMIKDV